MKEVTIYTDGACSGNPGVGGWCAILMYNNHQKIVSGYSKYTTNNRMELFAIIQGLASLTQPCIVNLYSDSAYAINALTNGWIDNWKSNGWKSSDKKEIKNIDLWKDLSLKCQPHKVNFFKVKGHSDNEWNNKCDEVARKEILKVKI